MKKNISALLLSSAFALSTIGISFIPRNASAQSSLRPYIVLVNGWPNCCARGITNRFPPINAEIRAVPYSNFSHNGSSGNTSNDSAFLKDGADFINNKLDRNRPLILIGHSFGGDSVLKLLPRINRRIQFVAVIDPVSTFGLRASLKSLVVPNNVDYFFNRWQENLPFPNDFKTNGSIPCSAKKCDQDSQNIARNADYSPVTTECRWDEVTCPGFVAPIPFVRKGKKGRKQVRVGHQDLPKDAFLQKDLGDKIQKILAAFRPPAVSPNTSRPAQNAFAAIAISSQTESLGWAWGSSNQAEVEKVAIQSCKANDCKSVMWVQNGYAAIAYGDDLSWGTVGGKSQEEVSQKAIQSCKQVSQNPQSCTVVIVVESTKGTIVNNPIPTKAKPESKGCVSVDSKLGWQHFNFSGNFTKVASISGGWSVDSRSYSAVGASGHTGNDAELLTPYNQYKFDQNFPFGALLMGSGQGTLWIQDSTSLSSAPFGAVDMRINDADNALGDNEGKLEVCFGN